MTILYLAADRLTEDYAELNLWHVLLSFIHWKGQSFEWLKERGYHLFADCGAFTVSGGFAAVDIEAYARFCHKIKDHADAYANLDIIGDSVGTFENQQALEDLGLHPVPVIHRYEEGWDEHLKTYLKDHDYVGLGGVADPKSRDISSKWMREVMVIISDERPDVKTHFFGVTTIEEVIKYRPFSCDSSTHLNCARFNRYMLYKGNGKIQQVDAKEVFKRTGLQLWNCPRIVRHAHALSQWKHVVEYMARIIPSSEEPFKKSEIEMF